MKIPLGRPSNEYFSYRLVMNKDYGNISIKEVCTDEYNRIISISKPIVLENFENIEDLKFELFLIQQALQQPILEQ
jgi:hypothetical protein